MFRALPFVLLFLTPFIVADDTTRVDVTAQVDQPDSNTWCVSGICLSVNSAPTDSPTAGTGNSPTQAPSTVVVQKAPTCDVCEAGVFVFYLSPPCCSDGSVCDIAKFLTSGPLELPDDCGSSNAITFDACQCTFYCNNTLGNGGAPTAPPTLPPTPTMPPTQPPTTQAPTQAPTDAPTDAPTTKAPTTKAPTTKPPTAAPTTAPTTLAPTLPPRGNSPTQPPATIAPTSAPTESCHRCNGTHMFFVVFPICCSNQLISTCSSSQISTAAKQLPDNCDQDSITWDGCSCSFYCNVTSAAVPVNVQRPGNAPLLPVPQDEIQTTTVDIHFNVTKTNNNTHCISGTSLCITVGAASHTANTMLAFPIIASLIIGTFALL